jgi:multidrug efflux system membrane fusion protein
MRFFGSIEKAPAPPIRTPARIVGLGFALLGLIMLPGCSARKAETQPLRVSAVPVMVATVVQKTVPVEVRAIGNVEAYATVNVKSLVEGQLQRVNFTEGQFLKKDELLFKVDSRPFEATLQQVEGNLARDMALARNAQAQAERYTKLFEAGIVSKDQFDQFRTNADSYEAAVRADRAAVEKAKVDVDHCSIYSPIDGRTGSLMVDQGNVVKANPDTPLVVIKQISPIYVDFSVPEQYLSDIMKYMGEGNLPVEAIIPHEEQRPISGKLVFVDNAVDQTTGTIKLKGYFANQDRRLWPGQFVNTVLKLTSEPHAIVVPSQAVQTGQSGQYVFVISADRTAQLRPVVAGNTVGGDTVIQKGLQPGETVVTDGQLRLAPGAKVEIKTGLTNPQETQS